MLAISPKDPPKILSNMRRRPPSTFKWQIKKLKRSKSFSNKMKRERNEQTQYQGITVNPALGPKPFLTTATARSSAILKITTSTPAQAIEEISKQSKPVHKSTYLILVSNDGWPNPDHRRLLFNKVGRPRKNLMVRQRLYLKMRVL